MAEPVNVFPDPVVNSKRCGGVGRRIWSMTAAPGRMHEMILNKWNANAARAGHRVDNGRPPNCCEGGRNPPEQVRPHDVQMFKAKTKKEPTNKKSNAMDSTLPDYFYWNKTTRKKSFTPLLCFVNLRSENWTGSLLGFSE